MLAFRSFHYFFLSILSGFILGFSWPPYNTAPLLFIGFVPLLFIENQLCRNNSNPYAKVLGYSYLSFLVWNTFTTWWIYHATVFGAVAAIICNSFFMTLVFLLFHITKRKLGLYIGYASLILYWISFEYIHLRWDLSWPWLTLGNAFSSYFEWIQWYEYTGVLGGSLWILLLNISLFLLLNKIYSGQTPSLNLRKHYLFISILLIVPICYSLYKYYTYEEIRNPVNIVVAQPNIDPYNEKYVNNSDEQLEKLLLLASVKTDSSTDYVIGPETALAHGIWAHELADNKSINRIREFIRQFPHINFIAGISMYKLFAENENLSVTARKFRGGNEFYDAYNTAIQIDSSDKIQLYHKSKLVPGVEQIPYPSVFRYFEKYAIDLGGTTGSLAKQEDRSVFVSMHDSLKVGTAICYESIYGEFVGEYVRNGAQLIFIITNDGWWENTPGYKQHLSYARLRAIEMRRSIARSANTGISCFIDQRGNILYPTQWWEPACIRTTINTNDTLSFYAKHGDYLGRVSIVVAIGILLITFVKSFKKTT